MNTFPEPVALSDAGRLRDEIIQLLDDLLPEFRGRVLARRLFPVAKNELPAILVHASSERFDAFGKGNSGVPDFSVSTDITVAIAMNGGNDAGLDESLDVASDRVLFAIMRNAEFLAGVEGVTRITRDFSRPAVSETLLGVMTLVFTIQNSARFEPVVRDSFDGAAVDYVSKSGGEKAVFVFNVEGS